MNIKENIFVNKNKFKKTLDKIRKNDKEVKEGIDLTSFAKDLVDKKSNNLKEE